MLVDVAAATAVAVAAAVVAADSAPDAAAAAFVAAAGTPVADDDYDCDYGCDSAAFSGVRIVACRDRVPAGPGPARSSPVEVHSADSDWSSPDRDVAAAACCGNFERSRDSSRSVASASGARPSQNIKCRFTNEFEGK